MYAEARPDPMQLLAEARQGRQDALGKLLGIYRNYLALLARTQIDLHVRGRVDASDLVQETFLDACRDFGQFAGKTELEWVAWLRKVLIYNLARVVQSQLVTQKRNATREVRLDGHLAAMERSSGLFEAALVGRHSSPSAQAERRERAALVADQLARLPADSREVIVLRNLEGLPFAQVAHRMGRSAGAVRILWVRAVDQLRGLLEAEELL